MDLCKGDAKSPMNISGLFTTVVKQAKANSPEILTAMSVTGVAATSYLTAKSAINAHDDLFGHHDKPLKEQIKIVWKCYIPPVISGALTVGCIIGSSNASGKRTAAAVTAYSISERAFSEYKEKVVEQVGKNQEQKIRDEIVQSKVKTDGAPKELIIAGKGHVLCCELYTRRYFRSDMETLRRAQNDINARVVNDVYVSLDEFYDILGLPYTSVSNKLGWTSDKLMALEYSAVMSESGEPCVAFDYNYVNPI